MPTARLSADRALLSAHTPDGPVCLLAEIISEGRVCARPRGFMATIVNGEPIVEDGKLTRARPGRFLRPGAGLDGSQT